MTKTCETLASCRQHQKYLGIDARSDGRVLLEKYVCKVCGRKWGEVYIKASVQVVLNVRRNEDRIFTSRDGFEKTLAHIHNHSEELYVADEYQPEEENTQ